RALAGDLSREVLAAARGQVGARATDAGPVALLCFDALRAPFADRSVDVVTCSLALHHFPPDAARTVLRELGRVTRRALIVSDLERCWPGYLGARLLAAILRNPMTHHDAPVSVLRAYTAPELRRLAAEAGLTGARVVRRFPFRLVLVWHPAGPGG
ncbi:MAG: methyltransferase domain-containing protein, partial [Chloroflexota bacterium]|nr:methyltransferase domain-containing protein [Chloroflexota bacterium]